MWLEGAILSDESITDGYRAIEDVWNKVTLNREYISSHIIENQRNSDIFERVYKSTSDKMLFLTADALKATYQNFIK